MQQLIAKVLLHALKKRSIRSAKDEMVCCGSTSNVNTYGIHELVHKVGAVLSDRSPSQLAYSSLATIEMERREEKISDILGKGRALKRGGVPHAELNGGRCML